MSKKNDTSEDDSDLDDLLAHKSDHLEQAPLNLDHLTKGQLDVPNRRAHSSFSITAYASAWLSYMCYAHPRCCSLLSVGAVMFVMVFLVNLVANPTETFGVIPNDYTNIRSQYDLTIGKIDHWCLKGDNDSCRCEDPLVPTSRGEFKSWVMAHARNKGEVESYRESDFLDVAFLGESLIEEMDGHWLGRSQSDELKNIQKSFEKHFSMEQPGIKGIALGIAGDTSPNVLWRIQHGEMPSDLYPRIWWLSLGMNDLGRMQCSEEVVILGTLRVVEEILYRQPNAQIVINSMLPMADLRGGLFPQEVDYRDAFRKYKGRPVVNPTLVSRNPEMAKAGATTQSATTKADVTYHRPETTTAAVGKRAKNGPTTKKDVTKAGTAPPPKIPKAGTAPPPKKPKDGRDLVEKSAKRGQKNKDVSDEAEVARETEPVKTKPQKKAEKKYLKTIKKDPVNPKIDFSKTKIKARDAKKIFAQPNRLPLWTSIHAINEELRKFAEKNEKVTFFDATPLFAEKDEGSQYVLMTDRISIRGHPTELGFQLWHDAVAKKLKVMLEKDDAQLAKDDAQLAKDAMDKKDTDEHEKSTNTDVKRPESEPPNDE